MVGSRFRAITEGVHLSAPVPLALAAGTGGLVGSFILAGPTQSFIAARLASLLAYGLPGEVLTIVILYLGDLGQALSIFTAAMLAIGLLTSGAWLGIYVIRTAGYTGLGIAVVVGIDWALTGLITGDFVTATGAGAGAGVVVGVGELTGTRSAPDDAIMSRRRRRLVSSLAGIIGLAGIAAIIQLGTEPSANPTETGTSTSLPGATSADVSAIENLLDEAATNTLSIDGIEPLVSERFYEVDINAVNPRLDPAGWSLAITGEVERDATIDYDELVSLPAEHRFITLRCVGETLNGHKMDNALWTGIPITELLKGVTLTEGCQCVMLRAADGYYEEFPLDALQRGFLAYGMNGEVLPRAHGYPVRALIPGHWGEINVKWITEIEFLKRDTEGYWEERGWHGTGPVNTVAKLHAVNHLADRIQVGGHAYAGLRGIDRVEVSVNGGTSWQDAALSEPLPGDDVWRQWTYEYTPPNRQHDVIVRATDGEGTLQAREHSGPFPSGATGWVSTTVDPTQ